MNVGPTVGPASPQPSSADGTHRCPRTPQDPGVCLGQVRLARAARRRESSRLFSVDEIAGRSRSRIYEQLAAAELAIMNEGEPPRRCWPRRARRWNRIPDVAPASPPIDETISRADFGENESAGLGRAGDLTFVTLIRSGPGTGHRYARVRRRRKRSRPTLRTMGVARELTRATIETERGGNTPRSRARCSLPRRAAVCTIAARAVPAARHHRASVRPSRARASISNAARSFHGSLPPDRCSSTKPAVSGGRLDPRPTDRSDDTGYRAEQSGRRSPRCRFRGRGSSGRACASWAPMPGGFGRRAAASHPSGDPSTLRGSARPRGDSTRRTMSNQDPLPVRLARPPVRDCGR